MHPAAAQPRRKRTAAGHDDIREAARTTDARSTVEGPQMKPPSRWNRLILLPAVAPVALQPALASYAYPLSSKAIREAYFLGKRNDEQTAACLVRAFASDAEKRTLRGVNRD
jgi:hypothetical protein